MLRPRSRPYFIQYERSLRPCLAPPIAPRRRGPILKRALALELHFHEGELGSTGVDDIVLDASLPEVGATGDKLGLGRRFRALEPKRAAKYGHDDVVALVPMQARRLARREPPLGHANALVVDLDSRRRLRSAHGGDFTLHP
jgi:hypothetical protein